MSANATVLSGQASSSPSSVRALRERAEFLKQERSPVENHWADIAELTHTLRNELRGPQQPGNKRMTKVFDGTAMNAAQNLASGLYGTAANPATTWFKISDIDKDFAKSPGVQPWFDIVSRRTLASFGPSFSNFYAESATLFLDIAAFGNSVMSSEMGADRNRFRDICRPLSECYWDVNADGEVNGLYRRPKSTTARQLVMNFGADKVSGRVQRLARETPDAVVDWVHAVVPNDAFVEGRFGHDGKRWVSVNFEIEGEHEISRGGFDDFPYFVPRWAVAAGEKWGRGRGELALADNRSLQVMARANLAAGELAANPPWGAPDEGRISVVRTAPGKITYGAVNSRGEQLVKRLVENINAPFSLEIANQVRDAIKDAFFFSVIQLAGRTGMTATEVMERQEEKMRLMGPYIGRIQSEFLTPLVMRRFHLLSQIPGVFPPPPPALRGRSLQVEFTSPMALAQRSASANGVLRAVAGIAQIAQIDPSALDKLNGDKAVDVLLDGLGVPEVVNDDETVKARRQAREQAQANMAMAQAAKPIADAAKSGAEAVNTLQPQRNAA
jgi:hypothetical protein